MPPLFGKQMQMETGDRELGKRTLVSHKLSLHMGKCQEGRLK